MNTAEVVENILEHHGVLGMKWGRRSTRGGETGSKRDIRRQTDTSFMLRTGTTKKDFKDARKDAKWYKKNLTSNPARGIYNKKVTNNIMKDAIKSMQPEIKALNKQPEFSSRAARKAIKNNRFNLHPDDPTAKKYNKDVSAIYMKHVVAAAPKHISTSPSGKWQTDLKVGPNYWDVQLKQVDTTKHSSITDPDISVRVQPVFDEDGYIVDFEIVNDLAQSSIDNVLEHHGVLGMKWGHRRAGGPEAVTTSDKARRVKTSGGRGHPAHPEAIGKATTGQILSKSGAKALSNSQLKAYNERMNLEANARRLAVNDMSAGKRFVAVHIRKVATQQVSEVSSQVASQQVKKHLTSRLIKTAAVAAA